MQHIRGWRTALVALAILVAARAEAASTTYQYAGGQATVTASANGSTLGVATLTLNGVFADFDATTGMLTDFEFTTTPNQWILLNTVYGGYDQVWINSASMVPGTGYATIATTEVTPGHWNTSVMPVDVNAVWTGKNSQTMATAGPFPLSYTNATPLNATIDVLSGTFTLQGITLGVIPVPGEAYPVIVQANLTFQGATPVPEPAAMGLLALAGGAGLAWLRKRE